MPEITSENPERDRLNEPGWRRWGTYVSDRQWGTVREDYSEDGSAWSYFPHDHARSRAYRWGEDGIGGVCDDDQTLCLSLALWNGQDPILKERLFGLSNSEGNHGEDVKELYYYLDATPTQSYARMLYKYPQGAYPYAQLVETNRRRDKSQPEFELLDTGLFDDDRYFDVQIEYAKAGPDDILMRVTAINRGPEAARLHLLPQIWFRNQWSWSDDAEKPNLHADGDARIVLDHAGMGRWVADLDAPQALLFCENETNAARVFGMQGAPAGHYKDAINDCIVDGRSDAVNPGRTGTKAAGLFVLDIEAGGQQAVRLRLRPADGAAKPAFDGFDDVVARRRDEADRFYAAVQAHIDDDEAREIQRQAFAGLIWSKQFYNYNVRKWLEGDPAEPAPPASRLAGRNSGWRHLDNATIISMPDKWEYPWYAAWDLAFHCMTLALVDPGFAKSQLLLLGREWYMHPNGQMPAYEWNFGDVNPPVHALATWKVYEADRAANGGRGDRDFLERVFHKLMLNFTWWVNRKDKDGHNIFEGGFLGLDNIGVFDRSAPLPTGGYIEQADGTSWMAMYCLNLNRIALELAHGDPVYEDIATKFFEHFLHIAGALNDFGGDGVGLWDEEEGFYYDALSLPNGDKVPLKVDSIVGLIPLFAVEVVDDGLLDGLDTFNTRLGWFVTHHEDLARLVSHWQNPGRDGRRLLSLVRVVRMKKLMRRMLDEARFLSPHGVRAVSRHHLDHPYEFDTDGRAFRVEYEPGESRSGLFGGNSNWRGPVWMPINYLLIESLRRFGRYYGDEVTVEYPTGSGNQMPLGQIADALSNRLIGLFRQGADGHRPVFSDHPKQRDDEHFRDHLLFYEYFHGDTGRGVGASHQTGWSALVANLIDETYRP